MSAWQFQTRDEFKQVLHLEFPEDVAEEWLSSHPDRSGLSYGYLLHIWTTP